MAEDIDRSIWMQCSTVPGVHFWRRDDGVLIRQNVHTGLWRIVWPDNDMGPAVHETASAAAVIVAAIGCVAIGRKYDPCQPPAHGPAQIARSE